MVDLVGIFGNRLGDTQFKQLMVVSAFLLCSCVSVTCFAVSERVMLTRKDEGNGVYDIFKTIWSTVFNLPQNIWAICVILFWAWIGWFPFQVYSTTFVGEVLKRYDSGMQRELESSTDKLGDITRVGSMALVLFSCVSLAASVGIPWIVASPDSNTIHHTEPKSGSMAKFMIMFESYKPDLTTIWIWGHFSFAAMMFLTLFASSVAFATFLVSVSGIAWALMTWAPFSLVGEMIIRLNGEDPTSLQDNASYEPVAVEDEDRYDMVEMNVSRVSMSHSVPPFSSADLEALNSNSSSSELSGV